MKKYKHLWNWVNNEKKFVIVIVVVAILVRIIAAIGYQWYVDVLQKGVPFWTDETYYLAVGWYQALLFKIKDISLLTPENYAVMNPAVKSLFIQYIDCYGNTTFLLTRNEIYSLMLACFYFITGYSPLLARFFNILVSVFMASIIYLIAKSIFNKNVAKLSFVFIIFSPMQTFLSISITKDVLINFFIVLALYIFYKMRDIKSCIIFFAPLTLISFMLFNLKWNVAYFLFVVLAISTLIRILDFRKNRLKSFILIVILLATIFNGRIFPYLNNFFVKSYSSLLQAHLLGVTRKLGETDYKLLPDRFYAKEDRVNRLAKAREIYYSGSDAVGEKAKNPDSRDLEKIEGIKQRLFLKDVKKFIPGAYVKGIFYVFFKPYPWHIKKITHLLASLQMLFWYMLFPFMCVGVFNSLKNLTKDKLVLMIFFFGFVSALALSQGNVGALIRHREIILFAYIIFGSLGIVKVFSGRQKACG